MRIISSLLLFSLATASLHGAPSAVIVSTTSRPGATGAGGSFQPVLSADGRFVAFTSQANNLATNDGPVMSLDVFLRDRQTGMTRLVSVSTSGTRSGDDSSAGPALSADGRFVAFQSAAGNLATGDTNGFPDVFLRDLLAGTTTLVSRELTGRSSPTRASTLPLLSADGRWVIYESAATNLVADDLNAAADVFRFDRMTGTNALVSVNGAGAGAGASFAPNITPDGNVIAFVTFTNSLGVTQAHVHVRDMQTGTSQWASFDAMGALPGFKAATNPVLNADGGFVFFHAYSDQTTNLYRFALASGASTLVSTNAQARSLPSPSADGRLVAFERDDLVFVWDEQSGTSAPVSLARSGLPAPSRETVARPALTANGGRVFFLSDAGDLTGDPTNGLPQLFMRDLALGANFLISMDTNGAAAGDLGVVSPSISTDGTLVAFESGAASLTPDDLNLATDAFVRDVAAGRTETISLRDGALPSTTGPALASLYPNSISVGGRYVAYGSRDHFLFPGDTNGVQDIFVRDLLNGTVEAAGVSSSGEFTNALQSVNCVLSAGGRHVAYVVGPPQFFPRVTAVFWRDLAAGQTRAVSERAGSGPWDLSSAPAISPDGKWVAFQTTKSVAGFAPAFADANGAASDVLLQDMTTGTNLLISSSSASATTSASAASTSPMFSPDGRWLAFVSFASNITTNTWNGRTNLYVRDLLANTTHLVSLVSTGYLGGAVFSGDSRFLAFNASDPGGSIGRVILHDVMARTNAVVCLGCSNPALSSEGRFVAIETRLPSTSSKQIVLHDRLTGQASLVSSNALILPYLGNYDSYAPIISGDARFVVFSSKAINLDPVDTNPLPNIYIRDRLLGSLKALRVGAAVGNHPSYQPALAADGRTLVFTSFASDFATGDYNDQRDVFVLNLATDSDNDGLDDEWEVAFFNNLSRDGAGDLDGDGHSDRAEFLAGTDPTNQGSVLRAQCVVSMSSALVTWSAVAGRTYQVEYKDHLAAGWTPLGSPVTAPATTTLAKADNEIPRPAQRFYRILLVR